MNGIQRRSLYDIDEDLSRALRLMMETADDETGEVDEEVDKLLLQLHHRDAHEHPHLHDEAVPVGNGVLLWFQTDEFDAAVARARDAGAVILEEPHVNPNAGHRECWLRDPDGYKVVLAGD